MKVQIKQCIYCGCDDLKTILQVKDHSVSKEEFELSECGCCGLIMTNPQPTPFEIGRYYQSEDYVSHTDTKKGFIHYLYHVARNLTLKRKRNLIAKYHKKGNLLDIGCGTGYFAAFMKDNKYDVSVMEPDPQAAEKATEKLHIKPYQSLEDIQGTYDIITMWHVLEHVHDINTTFSKLNSLLKENGVLLIAVPNPESTDAKHYKEYWAAYDVPRHLYHYKKSLIRHASIKFDMKVTSIRKMMLDSFYISMLSEKYKRGSILTAAWNGLLSNLKSGKDNSSSLIYIIQKK
jgi:2-polyprenyl-3-methyl-5-hydroxy-6-metoxy-1,4-benzoquinol methylase